MLKVASRYYYLRSLISFKAKSGEVQESTVFLPRKEPLEKSPHKTDGEVLGETANLFPESSVNYIIRRAGLKER